MTGSTTFTSPLSYAQTQTLQLVSALRTQFGARKETVRYNHLPPAHLSFVRQLSPELVEAHVRYRPRKLPVLLVVSLLVVSLAIARADRLRGTSPFPTRSGLR